MTIILLPLPLTFCRAIFHARRAIFHACHKLNSPINHCKDIFGMFIYTIYGNFSLVKHISIVKPYGFRSNLAVEFYSFV